MHYRITHTTDYRYDRAVALAPHVVRLRPRSDGSQVLRSFHLAINPMPQGQSQVLDLDGNAVVKFWFDPQKRTEGLKLVATSEVETLRTNPFDYLLEPWALTLPIAYPDWLRSQLLPYLYGQGATLPYGLTLAAEPVAVQLAQTLLQEVDGKTDIFLTALAQRIPEACSYQVRQRGAPYPPGVTWQKKQGSCRDFVVLFMEVCRAVGLAARFVSGYQELDSPDDEQHLHAWAEVYLPGGGWRGYDPTQGTMVTDRYVAVAASALPNGAAPVTGAIRGAGMQAEAKALLSMQAIAG